MDSILERALKGPARARILDDLCKAGDFTQALLRLRDGMRANAWRAGGERINLDGALETYDSEARRSGFHVRHDWDGQADRVNEDTIPVDVVTFMLDKRTGPPDRSVLAILLDYYFFYVLALLSLRAWDGGDADGRFDRLDELLRELQGPDGSGQRFADNAETLLLVATSHYELQEHGYDALLEQVRTLNLAHRTNIALGHASCLGSHLRFGFEATYAQSVAAMRADNVVDYPWLCFSLLGVIEEYIRLRNVGNEGPAREQLVEALVNGLSADPRAFLADPAPAALVPHEAERARFRTLFLEHRQDLLQEAERHRPSGERYSPMSFLFNFSHNVLKGVVVDALLWGEPWAISLNDLLTGSASGDAKGASKDRLAKLLMAYARSHPDRIRGRAMPAIVYDPSAGRRAFSHAIREMRF
jgi:hypothetical protein